MKSLSLSQPHAVVMVGIPGSGKTSFARKFADTFHAPFISYDEIERHARDASSANSLLFMQLDEIAKTHQSIVLEYMTHTRQARQALAKELKDLGYKTMFVWVQTDPETAKLRSLKAKAHNDESFDSTLRQFSPPHESEKPVVISGKHTYATQARIVLKRLSAPRSEQTSLKQPPHRPGNITVQ